MTATTTPPNPLSLQAYVQVLRRQRRLILVVVLVAAGLSMLPALLDEPVYAATSKVRVSSLEQEGVFRTDAGNNQPSDRAIELVTEMEIIKSAPIREAVHEELGGDVPEYDGPDVELVGFSQIVEVTVEAAEPATASAVANTFAQVYVDDRRNRSVEALAAKAEELREQSADASAELAEITRQLSGAQLPPNEVASLQLQQTTLNSQVLDFNRRADELSVEASLRGRGTQVHELAPLDIEPQGSGVLQAGATGLVLGLLLGAAFAVVSDTVQDKVNGRDDLARVRPDLHVLAAVPHADIGTGTEPAGFAMLEAFRYLRTGVRVFGLNSTVRSLLVTSAIGSEGKTTTAVNLARAMADAGDRVVLVDVDLRRPNLHTHLDLPNDWGLTSVVVGDIALNDVIHFVRDNLAVVTAGPTVENPTEILGSEQFARVLDSLVEQSDFTILDSSPVLPVADALIAGQRVDGALVVSRIGMVRRRAVRELLTRLADAGISVIGLVANDTEAENPYGYYDSDDDAAPGTTARA